VSRIGKKPIIIPKNVQVSYEEQILKAKGPKGELTLDIPEFLELKMEDKEITFVRPDDEKATRSIHGLTRSLAANLIEGVEKGFEKILEIQGVGFKAEMKNKFLFLSLGFSHPILVVPPEGCELECINPTTIKVFGIEKQVVGQLAAVIRKLRPPEPYKGKGIRYHGEYVRRKAGKTAA
jgi:large subunit ribosomal protein L6